MSRLNVRANAWQSERLKEDGARERRVKRNSLFKFLLRKEMRIWKWRYVPCFPDGEPSVVNIQVEKFSFRPSLIIRRCNFR